MIISISPTDRNPRLKVYYAGSKSKDDGKLKPILDELKEDGQWKYIEKVGVFNKWRKCSKSAPKTTTRSNDLPTIIDEMIYLRELGIANFREHSGTGVGEFEVEEDQANCFYRYYCSSNRLAEDHSIVDFFTVRIWEDPSILSNLYHGTSIVEAKHSDIPPRNPDDSLNLHVIAVGETISYLQVDSEYFENYIFPKLVDRSLQGRMHSAERGTAFDTYGIIYQEKKSQRKIDSKLMKAFEVSLGVPKKLHPKKVCYFVYKYPSGVSGLTEEDILGQLWGAVIKKTTKTNTNGTEVYSYVMS